MANIDRYEHVSKVLTSFGWLLDLILRNTRNCIVDVLKERKVVHALDACCGAGTLSRYLRDSGIKVTGVDASPSMLAIAREKAPDIPFVQADLTNYSVEEKVDAAIIAFAIHEMEEDLRGKIWETMKRATKQGGVLVVADFSTPERRSLFSRISWRFISADEKGIGKHDPGHFKNFQEFMEKGGIRGWLISHGETIVDEQYFQWGNIGVLTVKV